MAELRARMTHMVQEGFTGLWIAGLDTTAIPSLTGHVVAHAGASTRCFLRLTPNRVSRTSSGCARMLRSDFAKFHVPECPLQEMLGPNTQQWLCSLIWGMFNEKRQSSIQWGRLAAGDRMRRRSRIRLRSPRGRHRRASGRPPTKDPSVVSATIAFFDRERPARCCRHRHGVAGRPDCDRHVSPHRARRRRSCTIAGNYRLAEPPQRRCWR